MTSGARLSLDQRRLLNEWLPRAVVEEDHGWGLVGTTVLQLRHAGTRFIVKAGGEDDHHIAREVRAHLHWLEPWTSKNRAPVLMHFDTDAKLLVTRRLPGNLVLGADAANDPGIYHQAGQLLAMLHAQVAVTDDGYEDQENRKSLTWLSKPHRIPPDVEQGLRAEIASWPTPTGSPRADARGLAAT